MRLPINDKKIDRISMIIASVSDRKNRIMEQHSAILEIDIDLSDDPLIPTPKKIVEKYAEQEAKKEVIKAIKEVLGRGE